MLNEGVVAERGTHSQLLARGGHYAKLWDAQLAAIQKGTAGPADAEDAAE